ncbi:MAG TPA: tRNA (adenosine(37)-N6)-threonylcarbamoyltransferase complex dimerization subunit type 1 TsaB [Bacilli bacterium]|jgi:tRNA threonylcarbamoyladenosine biosynthesis protein TsaB|nr:tRNA (adenosine(37)-N6)-threonylcarbamoyltransferase complex dimerization subunit type 1 TsaB [Bacilli bacterium]HPY79936.1 tRNA (adenosine(37)-N6)-threonylcarbamoyltransferase complex dimerization subunit type 1 TsaB [Bacilli bacterium]HQA55994.1 tRNA (adenosine(37)-N6)-threonylcarbamoyltransferase complex dimerization subunit type 1 TsaB [Bacilli bacterium]
MRYTILLDSSNTSLTVGVAEKGRLIESISYESWQSQSEHMIPELDNLLSKYNIAKENIENIIVATGPGSYTGVRIALTIAKTIATVLPVNLLTVSSLRVLKDGQAPSICLINARSNRSYVGIYRGSEVLLPDQIMNNDQVMSLIKDHPDYHICGDTKYLQIEGKISNIAEEMVSLQPFLIKADNPLAVVPVYMRD